MRRNSHTAAWVRKLHSLGLTYGIDVLEDVGSLDGLDDAERKWIAVYRSRESDLTNCTDGGEGTPGWIPPAEFRDEIRRRTELAWRDGVYGNDAYLEKHRVRKTAEWANPEQRAKLIASLNRPGVREARIAAIMNPENRNKAVEAKRTSGFRKLQSERMLRAYAAIKSPKTSVRINLLPSGPARA
jgi:hypothetical protein